MKKEAAANLTPVRQRTQYTCMATSLMMCLNAQGRDFDEDTVNRVMGAQPMQGASWEAAMNAAQHFGFRIHMVVPATVKMLKEWTDQGIPVMIAWNPEGRPWSHASVVFDVKDDGTVLVADPNIPDPDETVRIVSKDDFYHKWFEKAPDYLVRRPAMAVMPEITSDGRQVVASQKTSSDWNWRPWAKKVLDWLELNLGERPRVSANLIRPPDPTRKPHWSVSFLYPAGPGHESLYRKVQYDRSFDGKYNRFTRKWIQDGLTPVHSNSVGEFRLPDGTYVAVMGIGWSAGVGERLASAYVDGTVGRIRILGYGGSLGPNPDGVFGVTIDGKEYLVEGPLAHGLGRGSTVKFTPGHVPDPIYRLPHANGLFVKKAKASVPVQNKKPKDNKVTVPAGKPRSDAAKALKERGGAGGGVHQNREKDFEKGQTRKPKHKTDWRDKDASSVLALNIDRTGNIRITDWHTQEDLTSRLGHFFHALGYPADQKGSFQDWVKRHYKSELNSDGSRTYGPFPGIQLMALAEKFERTHRIASEADRLTDRYMEKKNV